MVLAPSVADGTASAYHEPGCPDTHRATARGRGRIVLLAPSPSPPREKPGLLLYPRSALSTSPGRSRPRFSPEPGGPLVPRVPSPRSPRRSPSPVPAGYNDAGFSPVLRSVPADPRDTVPPPISDLGRRLRVSLSLPCAESRVPWNPRPKSRDRMWCTLVEPPRGRHNPDHDGRLSPSNRLSISVWPGPAQTQAQALEPEPETEQNPEPAPAPLPEVLATIETVLSVLEAEESEGSTPDADASLLNRCGELFAFADADKSGGLDPDEVRNLLDELGFAHVTDGYVLGVWDVFDEDGNGTLDLEEVREMVQVRVQLIGHL